MDKEINNSETLTVESDLSEQSMSIAEDLQKELSGQSDKVSLNMVDSEPVVNDLSPKEKGINLDAPLEDKTPNKQVDKQNEESASDDNSNDNDNNTDDNNADNIDTNIDESQKIKVTVKGKERELTYHDIKSMLGREESSQQRLSKIESSDELKMGTLLLSAKNGDINAQKKLQGLLKEFTGAETEDEIVDKLEEAKPDFDEDKALRDNLMKAANENIFEDVKESVDFSKNIAIIDTELKGRMPEKVFEAFNNEPQTRRTLYDLVASGRYATLLDTFDGEVAKLPFEKRIQIEDDPEFYGKAFLAVVKQDNRQASAQNNESGEEDTGSTDPMNGVSDGGRGRNTASGNVETPNFATMTSAEFSAWKKEHLNDY